MPTVQTASFKAPLDDFSTPIAAQDEATCCLAAEHDPEDCLRAATLS
jgi:hypothetical protein